MTTADRMTTGAASTIDAVSDAMAEVLHLYRTGELAEAEARCHAILARDPHCGAAWDRLGRIAERRGQLASAEEHFRRAIAELADPAEAHNNLGVLLQRRGALEEALVHYRRAAALGLGHALLHSNLGCLLRSLGRLREAMDEFARALAIDELSAHAHSNLGVTLALQGETARALVHLRRAVALQPHWDLAHSNLLFCLNYADDVTPEEVAAQHRAFGRRHRETDGPPWAAADTDPERKLRVGLVSPDLRQHSVAYFIEPFLEAYDRQALEIVCYSDAIQPDGVSERLRAAADRWRPIRGLPTEDVAQLVRVDRIDILIDLAGHTASNRMPLFATRVAPVQMTYLGYPNTTGLDTVDWRITDAWADPPGMTEALHSEELLRVSGGFLCFRPRPGSPDPAPPPMRALGRVTFGSFNLPAKISPTTMALWAEILRRVPGARLCLKGPAFAEPATRAAYQQRLAASPLAGHDVVLAGPLADERDHLAAYGGIDVALDTWPYGGTTTTCEALWMGVPVVTLAGRTHAARVGASLLARLGEPALIADSGAGYVDAAVALATHPARLAQLRSSLRARMVSSGITDAAAFARHFSAALRRAWRVHGDRVRAASASVPAGVGTAPFAGNLRVVVPDTLDQITPYVLTEQHDWFEDEIGFVRAALARGERAVDIGANHGVYTLALAQRVGLSGRVWAFEPGRAVAERLRASLVMNGLPQAEVVAAAVSDHEGEGALASGAQSELGRLQPAASPASPGGADPGEPLERVAVVTLDGCRARLGLRDIAFVKIDAEGAEGAIIAGGQRFFGEESPLVMFEVRQQAAIDTELVVRFERLGYRAFRLIPGLDMLAPLEVERVIDPFTLNLFACRADRAAVLEQRGLLTGTPARAGATGDAPVGAWAEHLREQLFAAPLWARWSRFIPGKGTAPPEGVDPGFLGGFFAGLPDYLRALDNYAVARRPTEPPARRYAALMRALEIISGAIAGGEAAALAILQTRARIAYEAGERVIAVGALGQLLERCAADQKGDGDAAATAGAELGYPFLAVSPRFDDIAAPEGDGSQVGDGEALRWMTAAALEQRERLRAFSSFYTAGDPATRRDLEKIASLGYQSPEMARRLALVKLRGG